MYRMSQNKKDLANNQVKIPYLRIDKIIENLNDCN